MEFHLNSDPVEQAQADVMLTAEPGATVREVFSLLKQHNTGSLLICHENKLVGIFTERDALKLMAAGVDLGAPVESVMVNSPITIETGTPIADAIKSMSSGGYRRLPIVDKDGSLVGVVKVSGIVHYFVDHFPETVFNLPPEPNVVMPEREGA